MKNNKSSTIPHIIRLIAAVCLMLAAKYIMSRYGGVFFDGWREPPEIGAYEMLQMDNDAVLVQPFTPAHTHINRIGLYFVHLSETEETGILRVSLRDATGETVKECTLPLKDTANSDWAFLPLTGRVTPEQPYTITFSVSGLTEADTVYFLISQQAEGIPGADVAQLITAEEYDAVYGNMMQSNTSQEGIPQGDATQYGTAQPGYVYLDMMCTTPSALYALMTAIPLGVISVCLLIYEAVFLVWTVTNDNHQNMDMRNAGI